MYHVGLSQYANPLFSHPHASSLQRSRALSQLAPVNWLAYIGGVTIARAALDPSIIYLLSIGKEQKEYSPSLYT